MVGHYEMVAMLLNSLGVEPEPTTLARLDPDAAHSTEQLAHVLEDRRRR